MYVGVVRRIVREPLCMRACTHRVRQREMSESTQDRDNTRPHPHLRKHTHTKATGSSSPPQKQIDLVVEGHKRLFVGEGVVVLYRERSFSWTREPPTQLCEQGTFRAPRVSFVCVGSSAAH